MRTGVRSSVGIRHIVSVNCINLTAQVTREDRPSKIRLVPNSAKRQGERVTSILSPNQGSTVAVNVFGTINHPRFKRKSLQSLDHVLRTGGTPISAIVEKWAPLDLVNAFQCQEATGSYPIETLTDQKLKRLRNGIKKAEQSPS
ncbi:hypothetical protein CAEBREN_04290 [Caenorhabditis brenneri]|uniref:Uncharacterized protein n=1 Tax=Caenorhabditis brenneri TaxID=135651 RepID=G0MFV7_CAEBE|nr:hypothetical protein CAEBREN_04290 [Caenorhabditis brenneri]